MSYELCEKAKRLTPYEPSIGNYRVRLDANESFLHPVPADIEQMKTAVEQIMLNRYPDPSATDVCAAFAKAYGVAPELVTAGNGSDELISLIFQSLMQTGEKALSFSEDFSMYRFYAAQSEVEMLVFPQNPDLSIPVDTVIERINRESVRLCIFSNPCNPTSLGLTREEVRRLITQTQALIVLDEAYMDFWDQSLLGEVDTYDNLIILRTCSKALGLAGLRLGFAVASTPITTILRAAKSPYNVNVLSQACGSIILRNPAYRSEYRELLIGSRKMLMNAMHLLEKDGLIERVYESCTNFVRIDTPYARRLYDDLLDRGIIIRILSDSVLRITAGTQAENNEVAACLRVLLNHYIEEA